MITWTNHITFDDRYNALYKGINIGLSRELIQDLIANTGMAPSDDDIEKIYNSNIMVLREKKIDEILS